MDTNRITINNYDLSTSTREVTTSVSGFTVVESKKGPMTPVRIPAGGYNRLHQIFGEPSKNFPELYEVEEFIRGYDVYVSAPYTEATVPFAYITDRGLVESTECMKYDSKTEDFLFGISNDYNPMKLNNDNISEGIFVDISDSEEETLVEGIMNITSTMESDKNKFSITSDKYNNLTKIKVHFDKDYTLTVVKEEQEEGLYIGDTKVGNIENDNDSVIFTLNGAEDVDGVFTQDTLNNYPLDLDEIVFIGTIGLSKVFGIVFPKYPSYDKEVTNITLNHVDGEDNNILNLTYYMDKSSSTANSFEFSLKNNCSKENCQILSNYPRDYMEQDTVGIYIFNEMSENSTGIPTSTVSLSGGTRVTGENIHDTGWEYAEDEEYSDVDIFFDSQRHNSNNDINKKFLSLGAGTEKNMKCSKPLSGFIYNLTKEDISDIQPLSYGVRYWNICGEAIVEEKNERFISPMTGARARIQADIILQKLGGAAPMYLNVNGVGGQLSLTGFKRLVYKYKKDEQDTLVKNNYNPVVNDRTYGLMVVGQMTSKPGALTDWSYIGHVSSFLNFEKEVRRDVMIPQIGKPNNPYYRELRNIQVNNILSKRLSGDGRIWAEGIVDTSTNPGVNDEYALRARKFVINVKVKVDVFSEYVELNFYNVDQSTSVSN